MFGADYSDDLSKIKAKWEKSEREYRLSRTQDMVAAEDFTEGEEERVEFNSDRQEWAIGVLRSTGFPRQLIGTIVIRADTFKQTLTIFIE